MRWAYICPVCDTAIFYLKYMPEDGQMLDPGVATMPDGSNMKDGAPVKCPSCKWSLSGPATAEHFMEVDE